MAYLDDHGQIQPVKTTGEWQKRRAAILHAMQEVMGALPGSEKRCPLNPMVEEEIDCGAFVRRRIEYSTSLARVTTYLLVPKTALKGKRLPGILALHQTHALGQKVVVGLGNSPDDDTEWNWPSVGSWSLPRPTPCWRIIIQT